MPEFPKVRLDSIAVLRGGSGFPDRYQGLQKGLYPFIKVSDLSRPGNERQIVNSQNWLDESRYQALRPILHPAGAVVFAKVGGALLLNRRRVLTRPTAIDNNMMSAVPFRLVDNRYFLALLETIDMGQICQGGSLPSVNQQALREIKVFLPALTEQLRISAVLDAWGTAAVQAERLYDFLKKRHYALSTILLSKQSNNEIMLGSIGKFEKGRGLPKSALAEVGIPCLRYAEIYTRYGDTARFLVSRTTEAGARTSRDLHLGDIVFAASGETAEEIGKAVAYLGTERAVVGGDTVVLTGHDQNPAFLAHVLNSENLVRQKSAAGKGHSVVHIHASDLAKLVIPLPPLSEQERIASLLQEGHNAITLTGTLTDSLRKQKMGLIQQLLTGKLRIPESIDALLPPAPQLVPAA